MSLPQTSQQDWTDPVGLDFIDDDRHPRNKKNHRWTVPRTTGRARAAAAKN